MKKIVLLMVLVLILGVCAVRGDTQSSNSAIIQMTLLNQDPNPARAGDTVNLRFKIENTGGESVKSVDVELIQDYPFTVVNGPTVENLGTLDAYQSGNNYINLLYTVKIDKDAREGQYELKIRYRINNGAWIPFQSFTVNIMSKQFAQIIYIDKAQLDPGKETDMKFTINNVGNAPLQNMVFSWQEPNGAILPVYSGDTKYIKYLDVGQSVDLTYTVIADVNAKPGLYQLNLNLKAESTTNATPSVISTRAGVFIGGVTDFDVAFSESSQGQTSLSVANTGNNPAQSVSVKIPQQESFRITGTNSAIIGNLDKGDYTIVSFQIVSTASTNFSGQGRQQLGTQNNISRMRNSTGNSNPNNLRVVIEYTDTTGQRISLEKTVPIQFRSLNQGTTQGSTSNNGFGSQRQQESGFIGSTTFWILIIVIAIVGFLVFRSKTRREKIVSLFKKRR